MTMMMITFVMMIITMIIVCVPFVLTGERGERVGLYIPRVGMWYVLELTLLDNKIV